MPGFGLIGGGGGGGDAPDLVITDELAFGDTPVLTIALPESAYAVADTLGDLGLDLHDQFEAADNLGTGTITGVITDTVEVTDSSLVACAMRPTKDTYLDRDNPSDNFSGDTTMLAKANTAVVNDQKHAYIVWDLTGIDIPSPAFNSDVGMVISHNSVGDQPLFYETYEHTADPLPGFSNWEGDEPPSGTLIDSGSISVAAGGASLFLGEDGGITNPLLQAADNQRWFYVRLLGNTNLGGDLVIFTIESVEATSNKPVVNIGAVL